MLLQGEEMGDDWRHVYENFQMGSSIFIGSSGNTIPWIIYLISYLKQFVSQKKKTKEVKLHKEVDGSKKETSFISFSGEDSNTSMTLFSFYVKVAYLYLWKHRIAGFSMTSESQGPTDFASTQLLASEDSNSLYEPGVKRIKSDWMTRLE